MFGMGTAFDYYIMDSSKREGDIKKIAKELKYLQEMELGDENTVEKKLAEYGYKQSDLTDQEVDYINYVLRN